jgi:polyisoprenoid-binding protein YceI
MSRGTVVNVNVGVGLALAGVVNISCTEKTEAIATRVAPPAASPSAVPSNVAAVALAVVDKGAATFLVEAPLETIRGRATRFRGAFNVAPDRLRDITGQVEVDLTTLGTRTFDDEEKDARQTEHAHNWLELGNDVEDKQRVENQWAVFTLRSARATPDVLSRAPDVDGRRRVEIEAEGDLWLHGVVARKTVKLAVLFSGPAGAPTGVRVITREPFVLSLREHDVKPRDVAGTFLQGALERVGDKIVDDVQVSLDFDLAPSTSR